MRRAAAAYSSGTTCTKDYAGPDWFVLAIRRTPPRFRAAARRVWQSVPATVRTDLQQRWESDRFRRPLVFVVDDLVVDGQQVLGAYLQETGTFLFDRAAVDRLPDDGLAALAAHELVHGWQFDTVRSATEADEVDAEAMAAEWGFSWKAEYDAAFLAGDDGGEKASSASQGTAPAA
jgi:hypothetical protein